MWLPANGFLDVMHLEGSNLDLGPLRWFGFGFRNVVVFSRVRPRLLPRLLRHLSVEFARGQRLHLVVLSEFTVAFALRLFRLRQTL